MYPVDNKLRTQWGLFWHKNTVCDRRDADACKHAGTYNIQYTPLYLFFLTAKGIHSPDSREHLFRHTSSFSIRCLLLSSETCHHLSDKKEDMRIMIEFLHRAVWKDGWRECWLRKKTKHKHCREMLTLLKNPAETASTGLTARMTKVNFQPLMKPMIKDAMKVVKAWISIPTLSPIPSWIL